MSAVLTFIGYSQIDREAKYILIHAAFYEFNLN